MFLQAIPPESSVGNGKTPLLADWHGFGVFFAFFRLAPRRRCPALTCLDRITPNSVSCVLQAIPPESSVGNGKTPLLADWPHGFGSLEQLLVVFSAGSKTTLSCAYLWTELHQTRFPVGFLQAIPPESSVGNGKTPLLADWHGIWRFFCVFFGWLQDDACAYVS